MKASIKSAGIEDFLQDVSDFLEKTLSTEQLSRVGLEHRTRLLTKLSTLLDEYMPSCNMYMDMTIDPSIRSFFISDSSSSSTSTEKLKESPTFGDVNSARWPLKSATDRISNETTDNELLRSENESSEQIVDINNSKRKQGLFSKFTRFTIKQKKKSTTDSTDNTTIAQVNGDLDVYDDCGKNVNKGHEIYDDISRPEDEPVYDDVNRPVLYDDAKSSNYRQLNVHVNDVQNSMKNIILTEGTVHDTELDPIYDDPLPSKFNPLNDGSMDDDYIYDDVKTSNHFSDRDNISVVSKSSCPVDPPFQISAPVAVHQSIHSGFLKRRSSKKILASWRQCYAVLLPNQLLFYSTSTDNKPKECIDLQEGQFLVRSAPKQGSDAKRVKMGIFQLLKNDKLIYEFSTGNHEETEKWLSGLRAIFSQPPEICSDDDDQEDQLYDVPKFAQNGNPDYKATKIQSSSSTLDAVYDDAESATLNQKLQQPKPRKNSKFSLFGFKRQNSTSQTEIQSNANDETEENFQEPNDIYEDLPSPAHSGTPYASTISLNSQQEEVYDDISSPSFAKKADDQRSPMKNEANLAVHSRSCSLDESTSSRPGFKQPISVASQSTVYDTPPTSARPVSGAAHVDSFLHQISNHVLCQKSSESEVKSTSADKVHVISHEQEVYDTPTSNRPIFDSSEETYDEVSSPPRAVEVPKEKTAKQLAQFWVSKVEAEQNKQTSKKTVIHSKVAIETKSVGRSFSKIHTERPSLKTFTDSNSTFAQALSNLRPTKINDKSAARTVTDSTQSVKRSSVERVTTAVSNAIQSVSRRSVERESVVSPKVIQPFNKTVEQQSPTKKQPPPRPPAPASMKFVSSKQQEFHNSLLGTNTDNDRKGSVEVAGKTVTDSKSPTNTNYSKETKRYKARWPYVTQNDSEISLNSGEEVEILTKTGPSWLVRSKNKTGLIPKEYLIPVTMTKPLSNTSCRKE